MGDGLRFDGVGDLRKSPPAVGRLERGVINDRSERLRNSGKVRRSGRPDGAPGEDVEQEIAQ